jgi:hypothetical protein
VRRDDRNGWTNDERTDFREEAAIAEARVVGAAVEQKRRDPTAPPEHWRRVRVAGTAEERIAAFVAGAESVASVAVTSTHIHHS